MKRLVQQTSSPKRRARAVAPWRIWTALITAITFAVLISTAATHHHTSVVDDQDCAICSVVTHKITDPPVVVVPKLIVVLVSFAPFLLAESGIAFASPVLLPPSCGPPV